MVKKGRVSFMMVNIGCFEVINTIEENCKEDIDMIFGTHENKQFSKFEMMLSMIMSYGTVKYFVVNIEK